MPAFGSSTVPLPMKNLMKSCNGLAAVALAGAGIAGVAGSPLVVDAAGWTVTATPADSRRETAATDHSNGTAAGAPPSVPAPSHDTTVALKPRTGAAEGAAVIAGTAGGVTAAATTGADGAGPVLLTAATGRAAAGAGPRTASKAVGAEADPSEIPAAGGTAGEVIGSGAAEGSVRDPPRGAA